MEQTSGVLCEGRDVEAMKITFFDWFKEQSDRADSVGWVARWFLLAKKGRYPKSADSATAKSYDAWLRVISDKAAKAMKEPLNGAFVTAWQEFHSLEIEPVVSTKGCISAKDGNSILVTPSVARLRKIVRGSHEKGEIETQEQLAVSRFHSPPAFVEVRQRLTTTYGGDWVQLGVVLSVPCYPEEIEDAHDFCDEWVTEKITEEVRKIQGGVALTDEIPKESAERAVGASVSSKGKAAGTEQKEEQVTAETATDGNEKKDFKLEHPEDENDFGI